MTQILRVERACLIGHLIAMAFGLAGLLLVMPHPEFLENVPFGQTAFAWSMAGGGVIYIVLGAIAVALYAYRSLGVQRWLYFMIPALMVSLSSELLGTSIGLPFGDYSYLSGLGYKIAGLVPFTIPLSWFYLGLSSYLLARGGLRLSPATHETHLGKRGLYHLGAIALGALLLTSWDFVLDPAMSQTAMPFWYWHQPGAFYGMPYQNFVGWFGTGSVFMAIAAILWRSMPFQFTVDQLNVPLIVYIGNFGFATVMSLAAGFWVPVLLGVALGLVPAILCWASSREKAKQSAAAVIAATADEGSVQPTLVTTSISVLAE